VVVRPRFREEAKECRCLCALRDPNTTRAGKTGADVIAILDGRRIRVQVTSKLGEAAGTARAAEAKLASAAAKQGSTYGTVPDWLQRAWTGARRRGIGTLKLAEIDAKINAEQRKRSVVKGQ
jgi:hypothetical protein